MRSIRLSITLLFFVSISWGQTLKTSGKKIVDDTGKEILLKGVGLGGWMLMEGYMMQSGDVANTQHEFTERLTDLIGETKTQEFFEAWLDNHVTKKDIDSLAKWGFNSIRLPMHYNLFTLPIEKEPVSGEHTWFEKGFERVDLLLDWCEANEMYLILDLHAAPGGQGYDEAISDYDPDKPSLWEEQQNKDKTVALWEKLAERYKDEPWIGGYDLLNEVNWDLPGGTALRSLYVAITNAIRAFDTEHIIFIEGNWFANDYTGLTPPWDDNMAYSFHKYWSTNDTASIQWVLDLRNNNNVPLWMGESGENSNVWFQEAIELFEANDIGWSWWPMKRIETIVSPFSITFSEGYKKVLNYWKGGPKPSETEAFEAMMELAENSNSSNCSFHPDVLDAQFRQQDSDEILPFASHSIPGQVNFSDYDYGKINFAYSDVNYGNYSLSTGHYDDWNSGYVYRNDGVDLGTNTDSEGNGYHVGYVRKGEWINYTLEVTETANYTAKVRVAAPTSGGKFHFAMDGEDITAIHTVSGTGGWASFETQEIDDILLTEGSHVLTLFIDGAIEFNIGNVLFEKKGTIDDAPLLALNGSTGSDNNTLELFLNQEVLASSLNETASQFSVTVNDETQTITAVHSDNIRKNTVLLSIDKTLIFSDIIKLSYSGTDIESSNGKVLQPFTDLIIRNVLDPVFVIPGKVEVEDYITMIGLATESTTDTGGGSNIGYTDEGDYADYAVYVQHNGSYQVDVRFAAAWDEGSIGLYILNDDDTETELTRIGSPVTGDWQSWETVSGTLTLPAGYQTLRMRVLVGGFNMNWMDFTLLDINDEIDTDGDGVLDEFDLCPGTTAGATVDEKGCFVFTLPADNFTIEAVSETCPDRENGKLIITAKESYNYILLINGLERSFPKSITLTGLKPDTYSFCIRVEGEADFEQCFTLEIKAGITTAAKAAVNNKKVAITMEVGTAPFNVLKNGALLMETFSPEFTIDVNHGDLVEVKTAVDCEGVFSKRIEMFDSIKAYPNPTTGTFDISLPLSQNKTTIEIWSMMGQLISRELYATSYGKASLHIGNLPAGVYIAKVLLDKPVSIKIVKN